MLRQSFHAFGADGQLRHECMWLMMAAVYVTSHQLFSFSQRHIMLMYNTSRIHHSLQLRECVSVFSTKQSRRQEPLGEANPWYHGLLWVRLSLDLGSCRNKLLPLWMPCLGGWGRAGLLKRCEGRETWLTLCAPRPSKPPGHGHARWAICKGHNGCVISVSSALGPPVSYLGTTRKWFSIIPIVRIILISLLG